MTRKIPQHNSPPSRGLWQYQGAVFVPVGLEVKMYGQEKASRWKRFLCFVFGHDMVETSRLMHHDRDA